MSVTNLLLRIPRQTRRSGWVSGHSLLALTSLIGLLMISCLGTADPETHGIRQRVQAARGAASEMRSLLERYYGGPGVLRDSWLLPTEAPGQAEGRRFLADKLARAVVWQDRFVIGAIGSSVTAGTGNCDYDTYPNQLQRLLGPVLMTAGVELEVRNAGQGGRCGDSFQNQIWCLRSLVGDDADIVHYSWTYFESGKSSKLVPSYHEMFYRWALLMEREPIPQLIYANACEKLPEPDLALLERYGRFGANALCMTRGLERAGYPGKQWGVVGDTLHDTTRYGEAPGIDPERRRSLGVVFRNWHPGPLLFQTTADALAYQYSDALLLALDAIEAEPRPRARWPREAAGRGRAALPDPLFCDPDACSVEAPPSCAYYEEPRYGEQQISLIRDPAAGPEQAAVDVPAAPARGWRHVRDAPDRKLPKAERGRPECAHANFCAGFEALPDTATDWLSFRLPRLERGHIQVCCSSKRCGEQLLAAGAVFEVDRAAVSAPTPLGKCLVLQTRFAAPASAAADSHEVRLRLPARAEPPPAITHVIGL